MLYCIGDLNEVLADPVALLSPLTIVSISSYTFLGVLRRTDNPRYSRMPLEALQVPFASTALVSMPGLWVD